MTPKLTFTTHFLARQTPLNIIARTDPEEMSMHEGVSLISNMTQREPFLVFQGMTVP